MIRPPRGLEFGAFPIARTVADAAMMLDVMAGYEPGDPFVAPPQPRTFVSFTQQDPGRLRVGLFC